MKVNKAKLTDIAMNVGIRAVAAPAGAIAASALDKIAFVANLNPWLKGIGKIIIGAAIPEFHNKANDKGSIALATFGAAFSGVGGLDIAKQVMPALVSGAGNPDIMSGITVDEDYEHRAADKVSGKNGVVGGVVE